jgi:predicted ArsR family transcriptional regulator
MERGIEDAVVMDDKTFKSLTSKTRAEILKLLKKRNHTLSEIAEKLKISKTTAKEHLDILMEGRLIEQVPSTNIWKYYTLTKDGRKLVGEEGPKRVVITLVTFVIGFLLSVYGFMGIAGNLVAEQTMTAEIAEAPAAGGARDAETEKVIAPATAEEAYADAGNIAETTAQPPGQVPAYDYKPLVLGIAGIAIMAIALLMFIRSKRQRSVL